MASSNSSSSLRDTDIAVDCSSAGSDLSDLDFDTGISLFRLVQEALDNIRKHAEATHVTVRIDASSPNIIQKSKKIDRPGSGVQKRSGTVTPLQGLIAMLSPKPLHPQSHSQLGNSRSGGLCCVEHTH